jgi:hypothetical protein
MIPGQQPQRQQFGDSLLASPARLANPRGSEENRRDHCIRRNRPDAGDQAMTDSTTPSVFFHGAMPFGLKPNRAYRVYVLPLELIFIYAGSGENFSAAIGVHFGALGALVDAALDPSKKNRQRQEQLDGSSIDELIADHKHNYRAPADALADFSINPRSPWLAAMYHQPNHAGVVQLTHADRGKVRLCLRSVADMELAVEVLPVALPKKVAVNVVWDESKRKFIAKR